MKTAFLLATPPVLQITSWLMKWYVLCMYVQGRRERKSNEGVAPWTLIMCICLIRRCMNYVLSLWSCGVVDDQGESPLKLRKDFFLDIIINASCLKVAFFGNAPLLLGVTVQGSCVPSLLCFFNWLHSPQSVTRLILTGTSERNIKHYLGYFPIHGWCMEQLNFRSSSARWTSLPD